MEKKKEETSDFQKYAQLRIADSIMSMYVRTLRVLDNVRTLEQEAEAVTSSFPKGTPCPEQFADEYLDIYVDGVDEEWKDGVVRFFLDLVRNYNIMMLRKHNE